MTMPDPTTITLSNDGIGATVKGDAFLARVQATQLEEDADKFERRKPKRDEDPATAYVLRMKAAHLRRLAAAALAQSAPAAPAVPVERLRALVKGWRKEAAECQRQSMASTGYKAAFLNGLADATNLRATELEMLLAECAAALEALASQENTDG